MNMKAGRELDALIADKITNYVSLTTHWNPIDEIYGDLPHYSTNILDAWQVVEKLKAHPYLFIFEMEVVVDCDCAFHGATGSFRAEAETAPLAICLASLKAKGIDIDAN
jgi:hypothetical protein